MDHHDILFVIYDILAENEDAESLINCSSVNKLMNRTFNSYSKYKRLSSVKIFKLVSSDMVKFKTDLLTLLLVETQISPMIGETLSLVKYLRRTDNDITMGTCLDRLIPDNTPSGNDMNYKPGVLEDDLILLFVEWLELYSVFDTEVFKEKFNWLDMESSLDEFYRFLFKFKSSRMTVQQKNDWIVTYDNYSLYSAQNIDNPHKMTLYLNKLKTIYQMSN